MRPKHHSLAIIISTCVVIGAAVWFEVWCREDGRLAADFKPVTPLSEITVPDKAELSRIDRLEHSMPVLASPPHRSSTIWVASICAVRPICRPLVMLKYRLQ